jgi:cell division protein FtsA
MARNITTGIDIGTHQVKVVIAECRTGKQRSFPTIIGTGFAQSRGLRHGYIINSSDTSRSIARAVKDAEREAGVRVRRAFLSVGGVGLEEARAKGEVRITRADSEVTSYDIEKVIKETEEKILVRALNRKILHTIPLRFQLDGEPVLGRPEGLKGSKLEVEILFITSFEQHLNDLIQAVEEVGIEVEDATASPLAASFVTLTNAQKIAGCVLANIGAETVSIVVFENNIPQSLKVFPVGSTDITHDIALGLKISIEEAEQIKRGAITNADYSQKKLDDIIIGRLSDIFNLIDEHLKKIGRNELLPAGIILTGGGSGITTIQDLARVSLKLPSRIASLHFKNGSQAKHKIKDSSWAVAYGLCIWGFNNAAESEGFETARKTGTRVLEFLKQFLP